MAHRLRIKRTTAYSIVNVYQKEGRSESLQQAGGRQKVIDDETVDFIVTLIEGNSSIGLQELQRTVREIWPTKPHFSITSLSRCLDGECISLKMSRDVPAERNSPATKDNRRHYAQWMMSEGINSHRIYVDETGFNLWTKRTYGRAKVGERVNRIVGGQRGRNCTVICAISDQVGVLYYEIHFGTVNKLVFNAFMNSLCTIIGDTPSVIIMDNAPIHNGIQEIYPEVPIKFLPPYSPFLNPIENCFSVLKTYLKQHLTQNVAMCTTERARSQGLSAIALREKTLTEGVEFAMPQVTHRIVMNNYRHANGFIAKCFDREDIVSDI